MPIVLIIAGAILAAVFYANAILLKVLSAPQETVFQHCMNIQAIRQDYADDFIRIGGTLRLC
ncbi:MAG: hypothetical protein JWO51_1663 [Rhodospirillales bacterium]|jgi:hypothetical protein|nr:hypothetical protein [Rhodospirillales bacterium]